MGRGERSRLQLLLMSSHDFSMKIHVFNFVPIDENSMVFYNVPMKSQDFSIRHRGAAAQLLSAPRGRGGGGLRGVLGDRWVHVVSESARAYSYYSSQ